MPIYKYDPKSITGYNYSTVFSNGDNAEKDKTCGFLESLIGWSELMYEHAQKSPEGFFGYLEFSDPLDTKKEGKTLSKDLRDLSSINDNKKFSAKNLDTFAANKGKELTGTLGSFLASGGLVKAMERSSQYKEGNARDKGEFYAYFIEPMFANNGRLFKSIVTEYAKSLKKSPDEAAQIAENLYNDQFKKVKETFAFNSVITGRIKELVPESEILVEDKNAMIPNVPQKVTKEEVHKNFIFANDYDPSSLSNFEIVRFEELADDDKEQASVFVNGAINWLGKAREYSVKNGFPVFNYKVTDSLGGERNAGAKIRENVNEFLDNKRRINKDTVESFWQEEGGALLGNIATLLSTGALSRCMKNDRIPTKKRAEFYLDMVEPMMADSGKVFKDFMFNAALATGKDENEAFRYASDAYYDEMKEINKYVKNDFDLSNEIIEQRNQRNEKNNAKDNIIENNIINTNVNNINNDIKINNEIKDPYEELVEAQIKERDQRRADMKEAVLNDRQIYKLPDYREAVNLFGSTKILAFGPETDEHKFITNDIRKYNDFLQKNNASTNSTLNLDGLTDEQKMEKLAEQVYTLDKMKRHVKTYVDQKTEKGLPNTSAGKDRLAGAFCIGEHVEDWIKRTENQIKELGFAHNLKEFRNSKEYNKKALELAKDKLKNTKVLGKGTEPKVIDDLYDIANFCALKIKYDMVTNFDGDSVNIPEIQDKFKNKSVSEIRKELMLDKDFRTVTAEHLASCGHDGAESVSTSNSLFDKYEREVHAKAFNARENQRINNNNLSF